MPQISPLYWCYSSFLFLLMVTMLIVMVDWDRSIYKEEFMLSLTELDVKW